MSMRMNHRSARSEFPVSELGPYLGIQIVKNVDRPTGSSFANEETTNLRPVRTVERSRSFGEVIDPAIEAQWLKEFYQTLPAGAKLRPMNDYRAAYHYGLLEKSTRRKVPFEKVEEALEDQWCLHDGSSELAWTEAKPVVRHAYHRPLPFPHSK